MYIDCVAETAPDFDFWNFDNELTERGLRDLFLAARMRYNSHVFKQLLLDDDIDNHPFFWGTYLDLLEAPLVVRPAATEEEKEYAWTPRLDIAYTAGMLSIAEFSPELVEVIGHDRSNEMREKAAFAIGCIMREHKIRERDAAVEALVNNLLNNDNYFTRVECAEALGYSGSERAVDPLIDIAEDEAAKSGYEIDPDNLSILLNSCCEALSYLGTKRARDALKRFFYHPNPNVHHDASNPTHFLAIRRERSLLNDIMKMLEGEFSVEKMEAIEGRTASVLEDRKNYYVRALLDEVHVPGVYI